MKRTPLGAATRHLSRFLRQEDGSASIEALLWFPLLFSLLLLTLDVVLISSAQTRVYRVVQDANRAYAIGTLTSTDATQSFIKSRIDWISPNAKIRTTLNSGVIESAVVMPFTDLSSIGVLPNFENLTVGVVAQHLKEPTV